MSSPASVSGIQSAGWMNSRDTFKSKFCFAAFIIMMKLIALPSIAYAGSFSINPVRIHLSESATSSVLQIANTGNADVTVQLQAMKWSQADGEDELKVTRDLIATPQIFNLKAGASQIIRIGLAKKPDLTIEAAYRLLFEEIPPPPEPGFQGLKLALRLSLPVFVKPNHRIEPDFHIRLSRPSHTASDTVNLELDNAGSTHIQLLNLTVHPEDKRDELLGSLDKRLYLLARQKKQLSIKIKGSHELPRSLLIRAETSTGKVEFHATSGAP